MHSTCTKYGERQFECTFSLLNDLQWPVNKQVGVFSSQKKLVWNSPTSKEWKTLLG